MTTEVELLEQEMHKLASGSREWRNFSAQLRKSRDQLTEYTEKYSDHASASATFLRQAIDMFARSLATSQKGDESDTVIRLCSLWFSNFRDDRLNALIRQPLLFIPHHKFIFMSHQLSSRLSNNEFHEGQKTLEKIMRSLIGLHTFHTFYQIFALSQGAPSSSGASGSRRTSRNAPVAEDTHRAEAAKKMISKLQGQTLSAERARDLERVCKAYLEWAKHPLDGKRVGSGVEIEIPSNFQIRKLRNVRVPIATDDLTPDPTGKYEEFVSLVDFHPMFVTAGGVNVPKITKCKGSDGQYRKQLVRLAI